MAIKKLSYTEAEVFTTTQSPNGFGLHIQANHGLPRCAFTKAKPIYGNVIAILWHR